MLRLVVDPLLRKLAAVRRPIRADGGVVKINLGSGIEVAHGWINVDGSLHALIAGSPKAVLSLVYRRTRTVSHLVTEAEYVRRLTEHKFVFCDFERMLPFKTNTVDFVFCSHVLEHFDPENAAHLVRESLRVLKAGGWARFAVPDLAFAVRKYQEGAKQEALGYFFTGQRSRFDQHRYMYDAELLSELLRAQGFGEIAQRRYREGVVPDLELLDNRPEETLYVEGRKSA